MYNGESVASVIVLRPVIQQLNSIIALVYAKKVIIITTNAVLFQHAEQQEGLHHIGYFACVLDATIISEQHCTS